MGIAQVRAATLPTSKHRAKCLVFAVCSGVSNIRHSRFRFYDRAPPGQPPTEMSNSPGRLVFAIPIEAYTVFGMEIKQQKKRQITADDYGIAQLQRPLRQEIFCDRQRRRQNIDGTYHGPFKAGPLDQAVKMSVQLSSPALNTITAGGKLSSSSTLLSR
jgi:hypothetical protein